MVMQQSMIELMTMMIYRWNTLSQSRQYYCKLTQTRKMLIIKPKLDYVKNITSMI